MPAVECPLCGAAMRLHTPTIVVRVLGSTTPSTPRTREWVCPDCDYFEDAEEEGSKDERPR